MADDLKAVSTDKTKSAPSPKSNGSGRPSVVSLKYSDKKALYRAYMPFLKSGGLFLPTSSTYNMGDEIFLLVTLPESAKPMPVPGTVVWKTPAEALDGRRQGIGIEFKGREGSTLRGQIEGILGSRLEDPRPTYTM